MTSKKTGNPTASKETVCIILAGGRGKRMGAGDRHKVCFPILGRAAIVRAIDQYKRAGLRRFVVVVGQMAHEVMREVSLEHPEVTFAYQTEPKGTGHAVLAGAQALAYAGYTGSCIVTMGDKLVDTAVIRELMACNVDETSPLAMVTLPLAKKSGAGRVLLDAEGNIAAILEKKDFLQSRESGSLIQIADQHFSADQIEAMDARSNGSLYLFHFPMLWDSLMQLRPDNQQGELYLTDTIAILRGRGLPVRRVEVSDPEKVMGFNTPAELLAIEEVMARKEAGQRVRVVSQRPPLDTSVLKPAAEWLELLQHQDGPLDDVFREIYGNDAEILSEQSSLARQVLEAFIGYFGANRKVVVCRAPGRINLMGRHVEHRGGDINVMAISRETLIVAAPRDDDTVTLRNVSHHFSERSFQISDLLEQTSWEDWIEFIDSSTVKQVLQDAPGDWSHYARAPLLRLQHEVGSRRLRGMDCMVGSNIPMGAGLSSSSALVVAFAQVAIALNQLEVETADFIDLCGEGEWLVGSRGGNGDHAAIHVSKFGRISHLGFFPFRLKGQAPFPDSLSLVVADSAIVAKKSEGARDSFNHRIASYRLGQMLLQKMWPAASGAVHLRDLLPENLRVHVSDLYRAIAGLPVLASRAEIRKLFSEAEQKELDKIFSSHTDIGPYDLRGVVIYGLAECLRSSRFSELFQSEDWTAVGEMMAISHDGDRVATVSLPGARTKHQELMTPYVFDASDASLQALASQESDLARLPGAYACSTADIDYLTDLATSVQGVVGAQLSGAGLGGCVMILVRTEALSELREKLTDYYYQPRQLEPLIYVCRPVAGAGLLSV